MEKTESLAASIGVSLFAAFLTNKLIRDFIPVFLSSKRQLYGVDQCKKTAEKVYVYVRVCLHTPARVQRRADGRDRRRRLLDINQPIPATTIP